MWKLESSLFSISEWLGWLALFAALGAVAIAAVGMWKAKQEEEPAPMRWDGVVLVAIIALCLFGAGRLTRFASDRALRSDLSDLAKEVDSFAAGHELPDAPIKGETAGRFENRTRIEGHTTEREYLDQYEEKVRYAREELAKRELSDSELDRFYADATSSVTIHIIAERLDFLAGKL